MEKKSGLSGYLDIKAFTLIELLVVVLIIGVLAAVAVPQYQKAVIKSRFATMKAMAKALADAQNIYYLANGSFASSLEDLSIDFSSGSLNSSGSMITYPWGSCYIACGPTHSCGGCTLGTSPRTITYFYRSFVPRERTCVVWDEGKTSTYTDICKEETNNGTTARNEEGKYTSYYYQ